MAFLNRSINYLGRAFGLSGGDAVLQEHNYADSSSLHEKDKVQERAAAGTTDAQSRTSPDENPEFRAAQLQKVKKELATSKSKCTRIRNQILRGLTDLPEDELMGLQTAMDEAFRKLVHSTGAYRDLIEDEQERELQEEQFESYETDYQAIKLQIQQEIRIRNRTKTLASQADLDWDTEDLRGALVNTVSLSTSTSQAVRRPPTSMETSLLRTSANITSSQREMTPIASSNANIQMTPRTTNVCDTPIMVPRANQSAETQAVNRPGATSVERGSGQRGQSSIDTTPLSGRKQRRQQGRQQKQIDFRNTVVADDQTRRQLNQQRANQRAEDFSSGVAEILEMGRARRWGQARINEAIQRYCQQPSGVLSPTSDLPQPVAASTAVYEATDNVMMPGRAQRYNSTGTQPAPWLGTGANAVPLGERRVLAGAASAAGLVQSGPSSQPQSQSGYTSQMALQQQRVPQPGTQQNDAPFLGAPFRGTRYEEDRHWGRPPPQRQSGRQQNWQTHDGRRGWENRPTDDYPPGTGRWNSHSPATLEPNGIFGNHSFQQDAQDQHQRLGEDWGYNPRQMCEKPLIKVQSVNFDGTSRSVSFEEFKATFDILVGQRNMPESQKVICLKQCLSGEPKKIVQSCIGTGIAMGSLRRAFHALENHYGGPQRMVMHYINKLSDYPSVKRLDANSLLDLIVVVDEIFHRYQSHNPSFLEYDEMMAAHVRKIIPHEERDRYYHELSRAGRRDTFLTLRDYLKSRYEALRLASIADSSSGARHSAHHVEAESRENANPCPPANEVSQHTQDFEALLASQETEKEAAGLQKIVTPTIATDKRLTCSFCASNSRAFSRYFCGIGLFFLFSSPSTVSHSLVIAL